MGVGNLENIISQAHILADELNNCQELELLKEMMQRIDANIPLKNKIAEFKKMSILHETKKMRGIEPDFEEERLIGRIYAEIMQGEDGRQYLEVENDLFDILNKVYEIIEGAEFSVLQKSLL